LLFVVFLYRLMSYLSYYSGIVVVVRRISVPPDVVFEQSKSGPATLPSATFRVTAPRIKDLLIVMKNNHATTVIVNF
jgi:hypothetical protein